MPSYLIIFGAAVLADGRPSGTMQRRVEGAILAGRGMADARYLPTGGAGAHGFVEADVMRQLLIDGGVAPASITTERKARNTLESARLCGAIMRAAGDVTEVIPCTSLYHLSRCTVLLLLMGWKVRMVAMPSDVGAVRWRRLIWYWIREMIALPYNVALLIVISNAPSAAASPK